MFKLKIQVTVQILITEGTEGFMFVVGPSKNLPVVFRCHASADLLPGGAQFFYRQNLARILPETKISPPKVLLMESIRLTS